MRESLVNNARRLWEQMVMISPSSSFINAGLGGGVRELQAEQVYNIAQSGFHYAIGKLQLSGAASYAGETITITSGSTTLERPTIIVTLHRDRSGPPMHRHLRRVPADYLERHASGFRSHAADHR
jgi:hypothetical protein